MLSHASPTAHGWCLLWDWSLIVPTVIADTLIAFAYFAIPLGLYIYWREVRPRLVPMKSQTVLAFVIFITSCGLTHIMDVLVVWWPLYWLNAGVRIVTAIASVATAVLLWPTLHLFLLKGAAKKRGAR